MCFAPWLCWLQRDWPVPRLALASDASTLGEGFVLLAVSVLYRRCALPVAWKILPAIVKGAWKPHWVELLQAMRGVLSDLLSQQGDAFWYGMRSWIEQGFKDSKSGGWQGQPTRREDPQRATRLWLAIAVATLWLLRVSGSAEAAAEASPASGPLWR